MLFNSFAFAIFLPVVFILYWFVFNKNLKLQNGFLVLASYFFYGYWDWRFLLLLIAVSVLNYLIGIGIEKNNTNSKSKLWLITGLFINIGTLAIFKYYNFFIDSFIDLISLIGYTLPRSSANIVLPVGISFYMFLSLSYIIDIYKKQLNANRNIIEVLLTLGFFPIILAGPIQRPTLLLTQIVKKRDFQYYLAIDGLRQILWGLFKKIVIADNAAIQVSYIFNNYSDLPASSLWLGALYFSFQIYGDFSGYSDIAIGTARLFGFNIMQNFSYPYFSCNITEFWKKWHISLTSWFRDYVFMPLSFSVSWRIHSERIFYIKSDLFIYIVASGITWLLTGLWHGANYTFVIWGMIHGIFLILYYLQRNPRKKVLKKLNISDKNLIIVITEALITLLIIMVAWVFFRSDSISSAFQYLNGMFNKSILQHPLNAAMLKLLPLIFILVVVEWIQRRKKHGLEINTINHTWLRWGIYYAVILMIILLGGQQQSFIYFQF